MENNKIKEIGDKYEISKARCEKILKYDSPQDIEDVIAQISDLKKYIDALNVEISDFIASEDSSEIDQDVTNTVMTYYSSMVGFQKEVDYHLSYLVAKSNEETIKATRRGFVDQLAVFAIVLTVLTFILESVDVFTSVNMNFYSVMASQISFILMATVMFSLIYIFLHLDDKKENMLKSLGRFVFMIVCIVTLSILTFAMTERANMLNEAQLTLQSQDIDESIVNHRDVINSLPTNSIVPNCEPSESPSPTAFTNKE